MFWDKEFTNREINMIYISILLLALFTYISFANFLIFYNNNIRKQKFVSYIPFVNGFIGLAGILLYPNNNFSRYWWVPFLIDWGCIPLVVELVIYRITHKKPD